VIAYCVFQNGCLTRGRQRANHLKNGAAQQRDSLNKTLLEARISAENDRRECERLASEIEAIKKQLEDKTNQLNISAARLITSFAADRRPGCQIDIPQFGPVCA
jgi:uncharacterized protein YjcR